MQRSSCESRRASRGIRGLRKEQQQQEQAAVHRSDAVPAPKKLQITKYRTPKNYQVLRNYHALSEQVTRSATKRLLTKKLQSKEQEEEHCSYGYVD